LEVDPQKPFLVKQHIGFSLQEFAAIIAKEKEESSSPSPPPSLPSFSLSSFGGGGGGGGSPTLLDIKEKAGVLAEIDLRLILKGQGEVWEKWPKQVNNAMITVQTSLKALSGVELPSTDAKTGEDLRAHLVKGEVSVPFHLLLFSFSSFSSAFPLLSSPLHRSLIFDFFLHDHLLSFSISVSLHLFT